MNTGPKCLGAWLDVTMTNRGLRNRDLARLVGVHESAVHNWRKGKNVPQLSTLQQVAQELGADPVRLAVTAGLLDAQLVGQEPLPIPDATVQRAKDRRRANELLDELAQLTDKIRTDSAEVNGHTLEALNTIRKMITGTGDAKS